MNQCKRIRKGPELPTVKQEVLEAVPTVKLIGPPPSPAVGQDPRLEKLGRGDPRRQPRGVPMPKPNPIAKAQSSGFRLRMSLG